MPDTNVPRLTGAAALTALTDLGLASIAAGAIARRRPVIRLLERTQADARGVARMRALRKEFGSGPVEIAIPGRRILVILDPDDVGRVLAESPNPFDPANREKRQALQQFQPHGVLISTGHMRDRRRAVNEEALDTSSALHRLAEPFTRTIEAEAAELASEALQRGCSIVRLHDGVVALVRRPCLARPPGTTARSPTICGGGSAGNWAFLGLPHTRMRERFFDRLYGYAEAADPNSLVGALAEVPAEGAVDPVGQVPQWLFAFDAAGMAALRGRRGARNAPRGVTTVRDGRSRPGRGAPVPACVRTRIGAAVADNPDAAARYLRRHHVA